MLNCERFVLLFISVLFPLFPFCGKLITFQMKFYVKGKHSSLRDEYCQEKKAFQTSLHLAILLLLLTTGQFYIWYCNIKKVIFTQNDFRGISTSFCWDSRYLFVRYRLCVRSISLNLSQFASQFLFSFNAPGMKRKKKWAEELLTRAATPWETHLTVYSSSKSFLALSDHFWSVSNWQMTVWTCLDSLWTPLVSCLFHGGARWWWSQLVLLAWVKECH